MKTKDIVDIRKGNHYRRGNIHKKLMLVPFLLWVSSYFPIFGQSDVKSTLYLKDGSKLIGSLAKSETAGMYKLSLNTGLQLDVPVSIVRKIVQYEVKAEKNRNVGEYAFRERGLYHISSVEFLQGRNFDGKFHIGFGLHHSLGYMLNRLAGLGLCIGVDNYNLDSYEKLYPIAVEFRSYLMKRHNSVFLTMQGGYALAFKDRTAKLIMADGGWMLYPAVGIRLGAKKAGNVCFDVGLKLQQARWKLDYPEYEQKYTYIQEYRRFVIKVSIQF